MRIATARSSAPRTTIPAGVSPAAGRPATGVLGDLADECLELRDGLQVGVDPLDVRARLVSALAQTLAAPRDRLQFVHRRGVQAPRRRRAAHGPSRSLHRPVVATATIAQPAASAAAIARSHVKPRRTRRPLRFGP
ncbi:MAG TPA: hypothetical protein VGO80_06315 [Solirubrobacteraceae bacterium]|jgi:hypothetical protein|nr:hypothetical protein [Solirubrobacteraceae bacterium]